jgi:hypothetical protein
MKQAAPDFFLFGDVKGKLWEIAEAVILAMNGEILLHCIFQRSTPFF